MRKFLALIVSGVVCLASTSIAFAGIDAGAWFSGDHYRMSSEVYIDPGDINSVVLNATKDGSAVIYWHDHGTPGDLRDAEFGIIPSSAVSPYWKSYSVGEFEITNDGVVKYTISGSQPNSYITIKENSSDQLVITTFINGSPVRTNTIRTYDYAEFISLHEAANSTAKKDSQTSIVRQSAALTNKIISTRILNTFSPKPKNVKASAASDGPVPYTEIERGMAAGGVMENVGVWGMGAYSTSNISQTGQESDGNVWLLLSGADKTFMNDQLLAGIAIGYENTWSKLKELSSKTSGRGVAVTPYIAFRVTDVFLVKGSAGFTYSDYSQSSADNFSGNRWLGDIGCEYTWVKDAWMFSAELATAYVSESFKKDYDTVYLWVGRIGGRVGYAVSESALPYVRLAYNQDFTSSLSDDIGTRDLEVALGANWHKNNWTLSLEGFGNFFRTNQETYGGSMLIRYDF